MVAWITLWRLEGEDMVVVILVREKGNGAFFLI